MSSGRVWFVVDVFDSVVIDDDAAMTVVCVFAEADITMTVIAGTFRLIASMACCTGPAGSHDAEPMPSWSRKPKSNTAADARVISLLRFFDGIANAKVKNAGMEPISVFARARDDEQG